MPEWLDSPDARGKQPTSTVHVTDWRWGVVASFVSADSDNANMPNHRVAKLTMPHRLLPPLAIPSLSSPRIASSALHRSSSTVSWKFL
jgi:hypothetical protein